MANEMKFCKRVVTIEFSSTEAVSVGSNLVATTLNARRELENEAS